MNSDDDEDNLTLNVCTPNKESKKNKKSNRNIGKSRNNFAKDQQLLTDEFDSGLSYIPDDGFSQTRHVKSSDKNPEDYQEIFSRNERRFPKAQHISSLFKSNPAIPHIAVSKDKSIKEVLFSKESFKDLDLHPHLISCLQSRFDITSMTNVQKKTIPVFLNSKDVLVKSCTGSGKTLCYAVPIVQKLQEIQPKIQRSEGVYALVLLPTRELALQCYDCFSKLTKAFTWIVPGYLIGGEKKKSEKARIRKGINVLISTPGRLLDHLDSTANLDLSKIQWLVIDEADRLLEGGYEEAVVKIINYCNDGAVMLKRQTSMLSATLSRGVEKLAGISMNNPVCIDIARVDEEDTKMNDLVVPSQLKQFVVVVPTKLRLVTLSSFIVDKCVKGQVKALVFMSTQSEVDFHFALFDNELKALLSTKEYSIKFFKLHGNMKQEDRTEVFHKFSSSEGGILLCTDVASRGLDLPRVDWIVQYSLPNGVEGYVHRVGRTARIGKDGQSLLFVIPSELEFVKLLQKQLLHLEEVNVNLMMSSLLQLDDSISGKKQFQAYKNRAIEDCATNLQLKFEQALCDEGTLHDLAREAFLSYVKAYASYPKTLYAVIPFKMLHLGHVAKSFCLRESPSQLGCQYAKSSRQRKYQQDRKPYKRPHPSTNVSEFGSGLDFRQGDAVRMQKRRKK